MSQRFAAPVLIVAALMLLTGSYAQASEEAEKKAVAAAEAWLELVDKGEFDKSWETAAALSRDVVPREQWTQSIAAARRPLGKLVFRKPILAKFETSLPGAPDGEYVIVQFKTIFENKAASIETVTPMKDSDGEWRVSGYFIK